MPSAPESLATRFADRWEFTEAPIADFGSMVPITRWKARSDTSTLCEKSPRKNCGGSSLARKGQSRISHRVRRGSLQRYEKLETDDRNSEFWNTWVPCRRSAGITSYAVHLVRTPGTIGAVTTWPS